ncbi:MAG TPA: hypothetical protein VN764_01430, partial [Polyangiaceae bacterium]|nr:hypothetical protein [Polyangiaceae bacterium]
MIRRVVQPLVLVATGSLLVLACTSRPEDPSGHPATPAEVEVTTGVPNIGGDLNSSIDVEDDSAETDPMLYRGEDCAHVLELTMRDFNSDHPDMQKHDGGWT